MRWGMRSGESIGFSAGETEQFLLAAAGATVADLDLHAGQLSDVGAAQLAARFHAALAPIISSTWTRRVAKALAGAGHAWVMLPGAYYSLRQTRPPPWRWLRQVRGSRWPWHATQQSGHFAVHIDAADAEHGLPALFRLTARGTLSGGTRAAARATSRAVARGPRALRGGGAPIWAHVAHWAKPAGALLAP